MRIRVLLADDHVIVRQGVRCLLGREDDIEVIAEAGDGRAAIGLCERHQPDVVVMDVVMPNMNGSDATREILRRAPETRVIALSARADQRSVSDLVESGARGYVAKVCGATDLADGVRAVAAGRSFLCMTPGQKHSVSPDVPAVVDRIPDPRLAPRERQVLQLLSEGKSMRDIAGILGVSVKTVEFHRKLLTTKLGITSVAQLTKYAIREGLTPL